MLQRGGHGAVGIMERAGGVPGIRRLAKTGDAVANAGGRAISRVFLASFLASCCLFWWMVSLIYRGALDLEDPVSNWSLTISFLSAGLFVAGFCLPVRRKTPRTAPDATLDGCERLSYSMTVLLFPPAIGLAVLFATAAAGKAYGDGGGITFADQILYYLHLFFGFMFLGVANEGERSKRRIWIAVALVALPRVVVSLHFGRIFLAQGIVPMVFIAVARGFVKLSWKRLVQLGLIGLFILFVPSITRGDPVFSLGEGSTADEEVPQIVNWLAAGSSLQITQNYLDLDVSRECPPLLVSLTDKVVPYTLLHRCTLTLFGREQSASLDRLISYQLWRQYGELGEVMGAGGSYLLELYLTGGIAAVVLGSTAFGVACKYLAISITSRSVFSGIWAECLMRAIFSPRSTLGYVFEKVPGLLLATMLMVLISRELQTRRTSPDI